MFLLAFDVVEHCAEQVCVRCMPCHFIRKFHHFFSFCFQFVLFFAPFGGHVVAPRSMNLDDFYRFHAFLHFAKNGCCCRSIVNVCDTYERKCRKKLKNGKWLLYFGDRPTCRNTTLKMNATVHGIGNTKKMCATIIVVKCVMQRQWTRIGFDNSKK